MKSPRLVIRLTLLCKEALGSANRRTKVRNRARLALWPFSLSMVPLTGPVSLGAPTDLRAKSGYAHSQIDWASSSPYPSQNSKAESWAPQAALQLLQ